MADNNSNADNTRNINGSRPTQSDRGLTVPDATEDFASWVAGDIAKSKRGADESPIGLDLNLDDIIFGHTDSFDPDSLLDDPRINPAFASIVRRFLNEATRNGFSPIVHEAYRSTDRARELSTNFRRGTGHRAAEITWHRFGLAADIRLRNRRGQSFSLGENGNPFPYPIWVRFIRIGEAAGLINLKDHDDSDHFEYHPSLSRTDWVAASRFALPVYNATNGSELEKLRAVWRSAGAL